MTKDDFEYILTGPKDLTKDDLNDLLDYAHKEKNGVEYKQEFDRESNNKIKLIDFCKLIIGFLNSDTSGVIIYGISDDINKCIDEPVSQYIMGHSLYGAKIEDLIGYIRERVWPAEIWTIHIKQLIIGSNSAITTIFVNKGRSKPYLYYLPNNTGNGVRSFIRSSAGTYELSAPQLHQFISGIKNENLDISSNETALYNLGKKDIFSNVITENLTEVFPSLKNPEEFGLYIIAIMPNGIFNPNQNSIKEILNAYPSRDGMLRIMENVPYSDPVEITQKWYRRRIIPYTLRQEKKCTWIISCHKDTGIMIITGIIDTYLKGEKFINPFRLSYEIQRLIQMAKYLYESQTNNAKLYINFDFLDKFGYVSYIYNTIERISQYPGKHDPIIKEIDLQNIQTGSRGDILSKEAIDCMAEIASIFGLESLPNQLNNSTGEMIYVQSFKGQR